MTVLIIDNYDSFTYNLVELIHRAQTCSQQIIVKRNDAITVPEIVTLAPQHIIISPGPGTPQESGISGAVIEKFYRDIPILGVCLGHQLICELFGATVGRSPFPVHGKSFAIQHTGMGCFRNLPNPLIVGRYHSLIARGPLMECMEITATLEELIMGVSHKSAPLHGVQFHPESFLTSHGEQIMKNFLSL